MVLAIILIILELLAFITIENDLIDIHDRDAKWIRTDYGREQETIDKDFKAMFHLFAGLVILIFEFCQIIFSIYILLLICKKTDLSLSAFKEKEKENYNNLNNRDKMQKDLCILLNTFLIIIIYIKYF